MDKKIKILIGILTIVIILLIIVFTANSNKINEENQSINNVNELDLKVVPSGEPNEEFIQNLLNKKE